MDIKKLFDTLIKNLTNNQDIADECKESIENFKKELTQQIKNQLSDQNLSNDQNFSNFLNDIIEKFSPSIESCKNVQKLEYSINYFIKLIEVSVVELVNLSSNYTEENITKARESLELKTKEITYDFIAKTQESLMKLADRTLELGTKNPLAQKEGTANKELEALKEIYKELCINTNDFRMYNSDFNSILNAKVIIIKEIFYTFKTLNDLKLDLEREEDNTKENKKEINEESFKSKLELKEHEYNDDNDTSYRVSLNKSKELNYSKELSEEVVSDNQLEDLDENQLGGLDANQSLDNLLLDCLKTNNLFEPKLFNRISKLGNGDTITSFVKSLIATKEAIVFLKDFQPKDAEGLFKSTMNIIKNNSVPTILENYIKAYKIIDEIKEIEEIEEVEINNKVVNLISQFYQSIIENKAKILDLKESKLEERLDADIMNLLCDLEQEKEKLESKFKKEKEKLESKSEEDQGKLESEFKEAIKNLESKFKEDQGKLESKSEEAIKNLESKSEEDQGKLESKSEEEKKTFLHKKGDKDILIKSLNEILKSELETCLKADECKKSNFSPLDKKEEVVEENKVKGEEKTKDVSLNDLMVQINDRVSTHNSALAVYQYYRNNISAIFSDELDHVVYNYISETYKGSTEDINRFFNNLYNILIFLEGESLNTNNVEALKTSFDEIKLFLNCVNGFENNPNPNGDTNTQESKSEDPKKPKLDSKAKPKLDSKVEPKVESKEKVLESKSYSDVAQKVIDLIKKFSSAGNDKIAKAVEILSEFHLSKTLKLDSGDGKIANFIVEISDKIKKHISDFKKNASEKLNETETQAVKEKLDEDFIKEFDNAKTLEELYLIAHNVDIAGHILEQENPA